ncbi:hypothetical protein ACH4GZ_38935 [Streptomyces hygroscopicus]|uniref:hypothetical protein n=1 Tax=Streptomyces hygroscopicus TaxID=1912 RepID=UPI0037A711AE
MSTAIEPTGYCFCGCGKKVGYGRLFAQGHDKMAEAAFIAVHHGGSVAQLLQEHGYGPDKSITAAAVEAGAWEKCPRCDYVGATNSIRNHMSRHHREQIAEATQAVRNFTEAFNKPIPRRTTEK